MATPDVSMHVEEVVVVTTPDNIVDGAVMEEVKTVLVTNLTQHRSLVEETMESENEVATDTYSTAEEIKEAVLGRPGNVPFSLTPAAKDYWARKKKAYSAFVNDYKASEIIIKYIEQ